MALIVVPTEVRAERMVASWYESGHTTADGSHFRPDGLSCAHRTLPFGTKLRVTFRGRSATCVVNDRGPFVRGRHLDMSRGMARALHFEGVHPVDAMVRH